MRAGPSLTDDLQSRGARMLAQVLEREAKPFVAEPRVHEPNEPGAVAVPGGAPENAPIGGPDLGGQGDPGRPFHGYLGLTR
ncbi:hypothetical protein Vau01_078240 [Virgisporangium aurantiacum]|uniref:Uncharacterized protein n=1 Tax=Virgisporangium aurantiacum TaxID=175570 RepID=A0A8J3ZFC6_9ACTN|nr:hypothetical protein Vau01_078240 [Virgisporangium aurantiacum]